MVRYDFVREKKEEYREIKPYYMTRFRKILHILDSLPDHIVISGLKEQPKEEKSVFSVIFRNGYNKNSPSFTARCTLSTGTGREEWGAEKDKQYFILEIREVLKKDDKDLLFI